MNMWQPSWLTNRKVLNNRKDECDWAKRNNGRTQPNSGRSWHSKGDTKDVLLLSDTKETQRESYTLRREDWNILTRWAINNHRTPCLKIKFVKPSGDRTLELAVVPAEFLEAILGHER